MKSVFGATMGLALTLFALPAIDDTAGGNGSSTQAPIFTGIIVSRLTSGWTKRKNPHKDVVKPKVVVLVVAVALLGAGAVTFRAYQAVLNYPVMFNGVPVTLREAMRATGTNSIFDFLKSVMVRLLPLYYLIFLCIFVVLLLLLYSIECCRYLCVW